MAARSRQPEIITGIDVGSSGIRVVSGQLLEDGSVTILGAAEGLSEGVNRGVITSIEDTVSSLSAVLERLERVTAAPIERAYCGISGEHIRSEISRGVVAVARPNGEISSDDVERVIEAAQAVATPPNFEILHVIPRSFAVDSQRAIRDPQGMTGVRLEVESLIIEGLSAQVKNLTRVIYRSGVEIDDMVFSILAAAEAVSSKRQRELGLMVVNLGGTTTSYAVYEEGDLIDAGVLPLGSRHITSDMAIGLRTSVDVAEAVKLSHGTALPKNLSKWDDIDLTQFDPNETERISQKQVAEIIEARCEEICSMVNDRLAAIDRVAKLPAGVILTGGGARLPGIVELAKRIFQLPAAVGAPQVAFTSDERIGDPVFSTALGLVLWGAHGQETERGRSNSGASFFSKVSSFSPGNIRRFIESFLP